MTDSAGNASKGGGDVDDMLMLVVMVMADITAMIVMPH